MASRQDAISSFVQKVDREVIEMGAFAGMEKFLKGGVIANAKAMNYSPANICVLNGDEIGLKANFTSTYNNLQTCKHNKDNRTFIEYGQDLVASWLFEDIIVKALNFNDIKANLAGADSIREILANASVSSASDLIIATGHINRCVEIMCDYTGYWGRSKLLHLRDAKHQKLEREKAILLCCDIANKEFFYFDYSNQINATHIVSHRPYGNKPAYELDLTYVDKYILSSKRLREQIELSIKTN